MLNKIDKLFLIMCLVSLGGIIMAIIWVFGNIKIEIAEIKPLDKLPTNLKPIFYPTYKWMLPLYFTMQSNILVFIYSFIKMFKGWKINKTKSMFVFKNITFVNITITMIAYWLILSWVDSFVTPYYVVQNIWLHLVTPVFLIITWIMSLKENKFKFNKKDIFTFLVYPMIYLIFVVILYYSTRQSYKLVKVYDFKDNDLVNKFKEKLDDVNIEYITKNNSVSAVFYSIVGVSIYPFFSFDTAPLWLILSSVFGIFILFILVGIIVVWVNKRNVKKHFLGNAENFM